MEQQPYVPALGFDWLTRFYAPAPVLRVEGIAGNPQLSDVPRDPLPPSSRADVDAGARRAIETYRWPGNVRELINALD